MRLPMLLAALLLALPAQAETDDCAGAPCAGAPVQEESPFLWHGRPLSDPKVHDRVRATYGPIIERYPDAASCLEGGLPPSADIAGRTLRWHDLQSEAEVDVCLFRVFARIGNLGKIQSWLTKEGFERPSLSDDSHLYFRDPSLGRVTQLEIHWSTKTKGVLYGNEEIRHDLDRLTRGIIVFTDFSEHAGAVWVRTVGVSKWAK